MATPGVNDNDLWAQYKAHQGTTRCPRKKLRVEIQTQTSLRRWFGLFLVLEPLVLQDPLWRPREDHELRGRDCQSVSRRLSIEADTASQTRELYITIWGAWPRASPVCAHMESYVLSSRAQCWHLAISPPVCQATPIPEMVSRV